MEDMATPGPRARCSSITSQTPSTVPAWVTPTGTRTG